MYRYLIILIIALTACSDEDKRQALLPNVTGKAGEVVLVINQKQEAEVIGQKLHSIFEQSQVGLPQDEPLFDLITIPPAAFRNVFERHRNIVNLSVKPAHQKSEMLIKKDAWAHPQTYISLQAPNEQELIKLIDSVQNNILKLFLSVDRERTYDNYVGYRNPTIKIKLLKYFGIDMVVPKGYNIDIADSNFMWITHETRDFSQGLIFYTQEYTNASQLEKEGILQYRDTLFKSKVPGPRYGSYMTTENSMYEPIAHVGKLIENEYTVEIRGLWKVENDFMGGPFVSYTILDATNNRIINLFGYVYAPRSDKRNYIRQVEAILRSFKYPEVATEIQQ